MRFFSENLKHLGTQLSPKYKVNEKIFCINQFHMSLECTLRGVSWRLSRSGSSINLIVTIRFDPSDVLASSRHDGGGTWCPGIPPGYAPPVTSHRYHSVKIPHVSGLPISPSPRI